MTASATYLGRDAAYMTGQTNSSFKQATSGLSELEKQALKQMIDRGENLPERYRHALFEHPLAPELIWRGKFGREMQPGKSFAVGESFGGPAPFGADAGARRSAGAPEPWRSKLFWGDNKDAMSELSEGPLRGEIEAAGGIRLIYIDPPFDVGADFDCVLPIGDDAADDSEDDAAGGMRKVKARAYRDSWGGAGPAYLTMMYSRLRQLHGLLSEDGSLYLHCDWRSSSALRLLLDEIFGREAFVNEIVWHYYNKYSAAKQCVPRAHDTIWVYSKSGGHTLNALREQRVMPQRQLVRENVRGVLKNARDTTGKLRYRTVTDKKCDDVWRIPQLQPASREWSGYGTQKHHHLLERIILTGSNPGDVVADFFSGSGTTLAVAERLGRKWIGCDAGQLAIHTSRKRLLSNRLAHGAPEIPAFDVLYSGAPRPRQQSLAGADGQGTASPPRPAADGDMPAYEAEFDVRMNSSGQAISVSLANFAAVSPRRAGKEQRLFVRKGNLIERTERAGGKFGERVLTRCWMDWVDYWAVDFDCSPPGIRPENENVFRPHWQSFRTYKSRAIEFNSANHTYDGPGPHTIAVQVVDLFGNIWLKRIETPGE